MSDIIMKETNEARGRFFHAGQFDCKTLARAFPLIAQALRDGTMGAEIVATDLLFNGFWYLPKKENPDENDDGWTFLFKRLSVEVFSNVNTADQEFADPLGAFLDDLIDNLKIEWTVEDMNENLFLATCVGKMQRAFDETLEMERWKARIQDWTGLPVEETCGLYKMPSNQFLTLVMEKLSEEFDTSQLLNPASLFRKIRYIFAAAQSVEAGLDQIESTCWECGVHCRVKNCSQCRVARYCSHECQKKSWKGGHKLVCKEMKVSFDGFMNDLELTDKAAAAGQDGTEVIPKTNPFVDYHVLKELWTGVLTTADGTTAIMKFLGIQPSIASFYKNYKTIVHGGLHWLFADQGDDANDEPIAQSEKRPFSVIATVLRQDTGALEINQQDMIRLYERFRIEAQSGTMLTAKRFIRLYETMDEFYEPLDEERDYGEARLDCITRVLEAFKEKFNQSK